jgi:hypothetical protein
MALGSTPQLAIDSLYSVRGMIDSTLQDSAGFKKTFVASRLDRLLQKIAGSDSRIDGIKIDVQGMELHVLEGMTEIAKSYRPKVLIEVHKGVSRPRLPDLIASLGYNLCGTAVAPLPGKSDPLYADDRTYLFTVDHAVPITPGS